MNWADAFHARAGPSVEDRLALAQRIWDSIVEEVNCLLLTKAQQQEVDRRLAAHRANPGADHPLGEAAR